MVVAQLLGASEGPGFYTRHVESLCQPFVPYAVTDSQQTFLKCVQGICVQLLTTDEKINFENFKETL